MIELSLLGPHALRGPDGRELTSLLAQPKRFALLACLAVGGSGGYQRRDTLAAMFWPDLDQFAARRALRNTLYHLREALGGGVIVTRGDDAVSVNDAMLTCDVARLGAAVAAGRHEEAVDAYRGEFLAGAHFASAGEAFEEWLSRERHRTRDLVMRSIRALVERDERTGNEAAAAYWAQRACTLAPGDEHWLRRAILLLGRSGDTGTALRLYDAHARRLANEFSARPSAETEALVAGIRDGARKSVAPARAIGPGVSPTGVAPAFLETSSDVLAAAPGVTPRALAAARSTGPRTRTLGGWLVAMVVAAIVVAVLAVRLGASHRRAAPPRPRVLVAVFDNRTGDTALQSLGRMTQDWIEQGILRANLVDLVDPRAAYVQGHTATGTAVEPVALAHRTGAALVITGSYYRTGDTLFFEAGLSDVRSGQLLRAVGPILASSRTPVAALDELRSRVMTALASTIDVRGSQTLTRGETPTFDAYQAYVEAWDVYWHGDGRRAEALFLRAVRRDSLFTAAMLGAAVAASNTNDCRVIDSLTQVLGAKQQALDRVDRLTLQIAAAHCNGRNDEMLRLALERADLESNTSSDLLSVAAAALWADRPEITVRLLARLDPTVDLGWSSDTTHFNYWSDLTEALHLLGRHREELAVADRIPQSAPLGRAWMRARALAALEKPTAVLAVLDSAMVLPAETSSDIGLAPFTDGRPQYTATPGWVASWTARELAVHGDSAAARQAAQRALAWLRVRPADERATSEERLVTCTALQLAGAYGEAEGIARQLVTEDSTNVDYRGELASIAAERGERPLADSLDQWLADQPVVRVNWSARVYRARLAALLGRPADASSRIREARDAGAWPMWIHVDSAYDFLAPRR